MRWLLLFWCVALFGEVREIHFIREIKEHLDPEALIVFDIDNTIMETMQTLGSDQWFVYRQKQYLDRGYVAQEALEMALAEWMAVQNLTHVKFVEKEVGDLIAALQEEGRDVMGLTTRGLGLATRTIEQLHTLGVDLSKTAPELGEVLLLNERGVLFRQGILFTAGTHKGKAFLHLMEKELPKKVLFINDKESHLRQVEESCLRAGIDFLGLRYGFLDEKVNGLCPKLVAVQWEHFGKLMSDEEGLFHLERINHADYPSDEI